MESATPRLKAAQLRYKADFDKKVRPLFPPTVGDMVYVTRESKTADDTSGLKRRHKLQSKADGPYEVVSVTPHTLKIFRDGLVENVSQDRVAIAPPQDAGEPVTARNRDSPHPAREQKTAPLTASDSPIAGPVTTPTVGDGSFKVIPFEKIIDVDEDGRKFLVRCTDEREEDSWEPPQNVPYNAVVRFFRREKKRLPPWMREYRR